MPTMYTPTAPNASSVAFPTIHAVAADAMQSLRALLSFVEAWSAARKRVADDREALASMSDRQLIDIGISRATADEIVKGSTFPDPRF